MKRKLPNVSSPYGAPMGRENRIPEGVLTASPKLHLVKLEWEDFDYDTGGAYWGFVAEKPDNVYWAYGEHSEENLPPMQYIDIFVRSTSRKGAKEEVREFIPKARFFN